MIYHNTVRWQDRNFYDFYENLNKPNPKWGKLKWYNSDDDKIKFIERIETVYDKVIYLDGIDMNRIADSYSRAYITNDWFGKTDYNKDVEYKVSKEEDINHWKNFLTWYQRVLRHYANEDNYFTYEGLFKDKSERVKLSDYLSIDLFKN